MMILRRSDDSNISVFRFFFCEECAPQSTNVQLDNVMLCCRVVSSLCRVAVYEAPLTFALPKTPTRCTTLLVLVIGSCHASWLQPGLDAVQ